MQQVLTPQPHKVPQCSIACIEANVLSCEEQAHIPHYILIYSNASSVFLGMIHATGFIEQPDLGQKIAHTIPATKSQVSALRSSLDTVYIGCLLCYRQISDPITGVLGTTCSLYYCIIHCKTSCLDPSLKGAITECNQHVFPCVSAAPAI